MSKTLTASLKSGKSVQSPKCEKRRKITICDVSSVNMNFLLIDRKIKISLDKLYYLSSIILSKISSRSTAFLNYVNHSGNEIV